MFNKKTKSAFTLAETLMTLAIIGVIAAMTMPGLQQHAQLQANVALVKKAYSTLSSATRGIKMENGPVRMWDLSSKTEIIKLYKQKMSFMAEPGEEYPVKFLNGTERANTTADMFSPENGFITADGMLWYIESTSAACSLTTDNMKQACIDIGVDVNGQKGPNIVGRDIFAFYVTNDGSVYPEGGGFDLQPTTCSKNSTGWGCTARVIKESKISW